MLGKLGRWLRLAGFDTTYATQGQVLQVLEEALDSERIILSRRSPLRALPRTMRVGRALPILATSELQKSAGLAGRAAWILLDSDRWREQFAVLMAWLERDLESLDLGMRCAHCNDPLEEVDKRSLHGLVPDYVYRHHERFHRCPSCERLFWAGSHATHMRDEIEEIFLGHLFECDHCGQAVPPGATKYRGKFELRSLYERMNLKADDGATDHWSEIDRLMGEISEMSQEELSESVHASRSFSLCPACKSELLALVKSFLQVDRTKKSEPPS